MNKLKQKRNEIKKLFFVSIKNDLKCWRMESNDFYSPVYNNIELNLDTFKGILYLHDFNGNFQFIKRYKFIFIPINFKIYFYAIMIKKHFKQIENNKKHQKTIEILESGILSIQDKLKIQLRKEKLKEINKK